MENRVIKKIGVVLRPSTPELKDSYIKLEKSFESRGIEVFLETRSAFMIDMDGESFEAICNKVDMLVSLGGDGTLISTVRKSFDFDIPIVGVYAGNLGFLANIPLDELDSFVELIVKGEYKIDERSVIEATVIKNSKEV
ncbi:MAG: NAD(+)/NADH kinase, partial [Sulfurimonas sp.]|nr:NAD(+)/NADH kinase [Sulfurimonas sp.]